MCAAVICYYESLSDAELSSESVFLLLYGEDNADASFGTALVTFRVRMGFVFKPAVLLV